ncbi:MAG: type II toxin-antitoxin system HipA family toxin [Desulfatirhabdiaceae bacterium]|nr:type II toxin-antitoxin system HipA family toxin [Desulfatirhabdiaceae bacterium]
MDANLNVFLHHFLVGKLRLDDRRRFVFQYDTCWLESPEAIPLSLSLPLRSQPYEDDVARPFFSNLLPEAGIRQAVARRLGVSEQNDFALLWALGGECAGAVFLLPEGQNPAGDNDYVPLNEDTLHETIVSLPKQPLLAGIEGIRLSLAGAQSKLPVYIKNNVVHLPKSGSPSSHILKPPIRDLDGTVENEAFCMTLAGHMGLPIPRVIVRTGKDTLYLIERYDRATDPVGNLVRIHQEDFCQALGVPPDQKYENEGGPSLKMCFGLLKEHSIRPAADIKVLLNWVVFNLLVGNADAHAKNIALLFTGSGPKLAPFYDIICTAVYEGLTDKMAMRIGGENRPKWIQARHLEQFSQETGIKSRMVFSVLRGMAEAIVPASEEVSVKFQESYGEAPVIRKVLAVIQKHSRSILLTLGH